jgi:hypothetical protein
VRSLFLFAACLIAASLQAQTVTFQSLLQDMTNRDLVAVFPSPTFRALSATSYNRASTSRFQSNSNDWFADNDGSSFIRTEVINGTTEWVIMDHSGPGCLTRLWTPFFYSDFNNRQGPNLRIYLDGAAKPVIDENFIQLVSGRGFVQAPPLSAFTARAGDVYLPIPYAKRCKVTTTMPPFFYNVTYRAYAATTSVETFTMKQYQDSTNLVARVANTLMTGPAACVSGRTVSTNVEIGTNGAWNASLPSGSAAIRQLVLSLPAAQTNAALLRSCVLSISFDNENTVWCPIGDFFSCPDSIHPFQNWQASMTSNGVMSCSWVMPYQTNAVVSVLNLSTNPVALQMDLMIGDWSWNAASMHFHARWRPDDVVPGTPMQDWNFVDVEGGGVFVSDSWSVLNMQSNTWWGEGDEKIYVNDEWDAGFPGQFGTGSEDYYGWAGGVIPTRADEFSLPFLSNVRVGGLDGYSLGFNINRRTRVLDAIPFDSRFVFDIEASFGTDIRNPWNLLGYSAVACFYAFPGATHNRPAQPDAAALPILTLADLYQKSDAIHYPTVKPNGVVRPVWRLGEDDSGAIAGTVVKSVTRDGAGTNDLSVYGKPVYSQKTPGTGSSLSVLFDGASYFQRSDAAIANLYSGFDFNNCHISCDVYPTALGTSGFSFPFSAGGFGTGYAIVEIGGYWYVIHHNTGYSQAGPKVQLNKWAHLELRRQRVGSDIQTQLWIDGNNTGVFLSGGVNFPATSFFLGANVLRSGPEGQFQGLIDNVSMDNLAPVILKDSKAVPSASLSVGHTVTVEALASGAKPLSYSWTRNGVVATELGSQPSFTLQSSRTNMSGNYILIVTNAFGAATSGPVKLDIHYSVESPAPALLNVSLTNGLVCVSCTGTPGAVYSLWKTSSIGDSWTRISSGIPDGSGLWTYNESVSAALRNFFRASAP